MDSSGHIGLGSSESCAGMTRPSAVSTIRNVGVRSRPAPLMDALYAKSGAICVKIGTKTRHLKFRISANHAPLGGRFRSTQITNNSCKDAASCSIPTHGAN